MRGVTRTLGLVALVLLVPAALYAQQAAITGTVKDASGPCCLVSQSRPQVRRSLKRFGPA